MTADTFLAALRRFWWVVLGLAVVAGLAALLYGRTQPKAYTASSDVYFAANYGRTASDLSQGTTFTQAHLASYAALASTPVVLDQVIKEDGLNMSSKDLADQVSASSSKDTVIVKVSATASSPELAAKIANSTAKYLGQASVSLSPKDANNGPSVSATVVAPATPPTSPSAPQNRRLAITGAAAGLVLGALLVLLLAYRGQARRRSSSQGGGTTPLGRRERRLPVEHAPAPEPSESGSTALPEHGDVRGAKDSTRAVAGAATVD